MESFLHFQSTQQATGMVCWGFHVCELLSDDASRLWNAAALRTASLFLTLCQSPVCQPPRPHCCSPPLWFAQEGLTPILERHCVCWGLQQVLDWAQLLSLAFAPPTPPSPVFTQICPLILMCSSQTWIHWAGNPLWIIGVQHDHIFRGCIIFKQNLNILQILISFYWIQYKYLCVWSDFFCSLLSKTSSAGVARSKGILIHQLTSYPLLPRESVEHRMLWKWQFTQMVS